MARKTWWIAEKYGDVSVAALDVTRTTATRLYYLRGGRETWIKKKGWFENWAEARDQLVLDLKERIAHHENGIKATNKKLATVLALKEPRA